jgi:hypothetical protein
MSDRIRSGLFVAEGTSDLPLAELVEALFLDHGVSVYLSKPDFTLLGKVAKDVKSKVSAGLTLLGAPVDVIVVHRDADNAGAAVRRQEIERAVIAAGAASAVVPVIPVRMTEAWLLLDEAVIRHVAGNPAGRTSLNLPKVHEVETVADPKEVLRQCLLRAADATGRRREGVARRFNQHRRQLLERLNRNGAITRLAGWNALLDDVRRVVEDWASPKVEEESVAAYLPTQRSGADGAVRKPNQR